MIHLPLASREQARANRRENARRSIPGATLAHLLRRDRERRETEADADNDHEPDPAHRYLGWNRGSLAELNYLPSVGV